MVSLPQQTEATSPSASRLSLGMHWETLNLPTSALFGTDGIRGKAGELLTAPLAMQVGYWAGHVLPLCGAHLTAPCSAVILGQDSRNSSNMLTMALSAGLTASGLEVWDVGLCPTPVVAHLAATTAAIGGVMVSASHNPPEDNGIKFFSATGAKLEPELQQHIEACLRGDLETVSVALGGALGAADRPWGKYFHRPELVNDYLDALQSPLKTQTECPLAGLKVVLDLAWGAATRHAEQVFRGLGAEVVCLHETPDGDRINVNCGSTHLNLLKAAVDQYSADLGFAFDGDADRVLAVDSHGRTVDGDYILYLWGQDLLKTGKLPGNTIVATVMSNLGFERAWGKLGGHLVRAAVGDQYVYAEMVRRGAKLGGEQSGHILCPHYTVSGDGLLTALHLAHLVQQSDATLAELVDRSFKTYPQVLKNVRVDDRVRRLGWQACDPVMNAIAQAEAAMGDQGRILVRASGTEPVIRVMVEAESMELVTYWTDHLATLVEQHLA
ncbi:phosphoglucosamine mutase [Myxacorys almedinensis]|uniref:Phosphoglucosamine mutase n=1 Tax=Myxacorys almedinensis A TaxID=2690445 RepID=A0A8J7YY44_9CYAN|nr:phosphoglucosamine mutase [Myxacorys almedinensis]NDJ16694.1 phosphoglucosamine mutase [Myxacorys almedinensis A]